MNRTRRDRGVIRHDGEVHCAIEPSTTRSRRCGWRRGRDGTYIRVLLNKVGERQQRRNLFQLSISIGYSYVEIRVYISFFRVRRVGEFSDGASPVLGSCCMLEISEN